MISHGQAATSFTDGDAFEFVSRGSEVKNNGE